MVAAVAAVPHWAVNVASGKCCPVATAVNSAAEVASGTLIKLSEEKLTLPAPPPPPTTSELGFDAPIE